MKLPYRFRDLVHYRHGREHGGTWADMFLEKRRILHLGLTWAFEDSKPTPSDTVPKSTTPFKPLWAIFIQTTQRISTPPHLWRIRAITWEFGFPLPKEMAFFFFVYFLYVLSLWTTDMPSTHRSQKRVVDPLEPELQMVVSGHVGAGNGTQVLWIKTASVLNHWDRAPAPRISFHQVGKTSKPYHHWGAPIDTGILTWSYETFRHILLLLFVLKLVFTSE